MTVLISIAFLANYIPGSFAILTYEGLLANFSPTIALNMNRRIHDQYIRLQLEGEMKKMILAVSLFSQNVMAGQFGQSGADGQSAWPGQAGADGATAVLDVDGKSYTFNSPGNGW